MYERGVKKNLYSVFSIIVKTCRASVVLIFRVNNYNLWCRVGIKIYNCAMSVKLAVKKVLEGRRKLAGEFSHYQKQSKLKH